MFYDILQADIRRVRMIAAVKPITRETYFDKKRLILKQLKGEDITAALQGRLNISNHLKEVLQNAEKEVIICTSADEIKSKLKLFQQTFANLNKANIKIKIALSGDEALINQLEQIFSIKIKLTNLDTKFFIVDRKEMLFYLSKGDESKDVSIWLNSEFFARAFATLFEQALGSKK